MTGKQDNAGVHFPPPFLFFLIGLAGWQIGVATGFLLFSSTVFFKSFGWGLILAGCFLGIWSALPFFRSKTSLLPWKPDNKLLTSGPYQFSRNPMYAGMALVYLGMGFLLGSGLVLLLIAPIIWIMNRFIIRAEEAYLTRNFGDQYQDYQRKVRRWL